MQIKPANDKDYAVIELDQKDQDNIATIEPFFEVRLPQGLRLKVAKDEILTPEGRTKLRGDILEIEI
jgi:hypothetical protein